VPVLVCTVFKDYGRPQRALCLEIGAWLQNTFIDAVAQYGPEAIRTIPTHLLATAPSGMIIVDNQAYSWGNIQALQKVLGRDKWITIESGFITLADDLSLKIIEDESEIIINYVLIPSA